MTITSLIFIIAAATSASGEGPDDWARARPTMMDEALTELRAHEAFQNAPQAYVYLFAVCEVEKRIQMAVRSGCAYDRPQDVSIDAHLDAQKQCLEAGGYGAQARDLHGEFCVSLTGEFFHAVAEPPDGG